MNQDIINIFILMFMSAFFSGSESALFSLRWWHLHRFQRKSNPFAQLVVKIMENPHRILVTILLGNTVVNIAVSSIAEHMLEEAIPQHGLWISIVVMTILLLAFGEITPKTIAVYKSQLIACWVAGPVDLTARLFWPVRVILEWFSRTADHLVTKESDELQSYGKTRLLHMLDEGETEGVLSRHERLIMENILATETVQVNKIITPRTEMPALSEDVSYEDAVEYVKKNRYRRVPLYRNDIDQIVGILYAKDLLSTWFKKDKRKSPKDMARQPFFVPGSIRLKQLFRVLDQRRIHLAIVLDEYGGIAGSIDHDNLLMELLKPVLQTGDGEQFKIKNTDRGIIFSCRVELIQLKNMDIIDLTGSSFRTLNGYLMDVAGRVPQVGTIVKVPGGRMRIVKTSKVNIKQVEIIMNKLGQDSQNE